MKLGRHDIYTRCVWQLLQLYSYISKHDILATVTNVIMCLTSTWPMQIQKISSDFGMTPGGGAAWRKSGVASSSKLEGALYLSKKKTTESRKNTKFSTESRKRIPYNSPSYLPSSVTTFMLQIFHFFRGCLLLQTVLLKSKYRPWIKHYEVWPKISFISSCSDNSAIEFLYPIAATKDRIIHVWPFRPFPS